MSSKYFLRKRARRVPTSEAIRDRGQPQSMVDLDFLSEGEVYD